MVFLFFGNFYGENGAETGNLAISVFNVLAPDQQQTMIQHWIIGAERWERQSPAADVPIVG